MSYLGNARPHQVEGEAGHRLYGVPADARLLRRVEHGQRTRVKEGQVAQLALLVACEQVKGTLSEEFQAQRVIFSPLKGSLPLKNGTVKKRLLIEMFNHNVH